MKNRRTTHSFHDGQLERYVLGPRNELVIQVHLDPVWNANGPESSQVRFGAIQNMGEVKAFFKKIDMEPRKGDFFCEVVGLVYEHKNKWILDLDQYGAITIESSKFQEL